VGHRNGRQSGRSSISSRTGYRAGRRIRDTEKVGKDAGELVGLPKTGVIATKRYREAHRAAGRLRVLRRDREGSRLYCRFLRQARTSSLRPARLSKRNGIATSLTRSRRPVATAERRITAAVSTGFLGAYPGVTLTRSWIGSIASRLPRLSTKSEIHDLYGGHGLRTRSGRTARQTEPLGGSTYAFEGSMRMVVKDWARRSKADHQAGGGHGDQDIPYTSERGFPAAASFARNGRGPAL